MRHFPLFQRQYSHYMHILCLTLLLVTIGIFMVYSASYVWANYMYGDPFYFVKRQIFFLMLGFIGLLFVSKIHYQYWRQHVYVLFIVSFILLFIVLVPGIGMVRGGARSWIGVGIFSIQPAEFIKLALIILLAHYYAIRKKQRHLSFKHFLQPLIIVLLIFMIIMLQPDFGTGLVIVLTSLCVMFITGLRLTYYVIFSIFGMVGLIGLIISAPYRLKRITSFLNPWEDPLGDGFQIIQSLYAIGPGQLLGVGFGQSMQKYFYLPEPQTDFIFSIFAEEFGLIGAVCLLFVFFLLFKNSMNIALRASDPFARYLVFGIITMITIQVCMNISVVIGLIPVTGITLPFLSYGGSSLMLLLSSIGIVLNISFYEERLHLDYN